MVEYKHDDDGADHGQKVTYINGFEVSLWAADSQVDKIFHSVDILTFVLFRQHALELVEINGFQEIESQAKWDENSWNDYVTKT